MLEPKPFKTYEELATLLESRGMLIEDRERAVELYTNAAKKRNKDAQDRLTELGLPIPEPTTRF